jgi:methionyl-tRNA synthetase
VYVWLDALANYLTVLGYPERSPRRDLWPDAIHIVGKDILKFHAVYWPAFLMGAGLKPPKTIFAHGWWTNEGQKISKSLGNTIDPMALMDEHGIDAVRYYLLREVPFGRDGDFKIASLIARADTELANELGNLVHRVLSLLQRHDFGRMPPPLTEDERDDEETLSGVETLPTRLVYALEHFLNPHEGLEEIWKAVRACNSWVNEAAPWKIKDDPVHRGRVLRAMAEAIRIIGTVLIPFIPDSAHRILDQLSVPPELRKIAGLATPLPTGTVLPTPVPIFAKTGRVERNAA